MARKPTLKKPQPLTAAIIAYPKPGEERGDAQCAGLLDYLDALGCAKRLAASSGLSFSLFSS